MRVHAEAQPRSRPVVRSFTGSRPAGAREHQRPPRILQREQDLSPDQLLQPVHRVRFGEGRELLAHQLAQVLQQPRARSPGSVATTSRHDPDEQQTERIAETSASPGGRSWLQPTSMQSTTGGLQRCQGMACPPAGCDHGAGLREGSGSSGAGGFAGPASSHELTRRLGMRVTAPNDPSERDADRIADLVLGTSTPASAQAAGPAGQSLQRGVGGDGGSAPPHVVRGGGTALPARVRGFFEPRLGRDLSSVRVHSDERAAASARSVGALAYTVGQDMVFGAGRYTPDTTAGRHLLAHELAHVIQQGGAQLGRQPAPDDTQAGLAYSLDDLRDSEPVENQGGRPVGAAVVARQLARSLAAAGPPTLQRTAADTTALCPPYAGYSTPIPLATYNCAGLAHRTYDRKPLAATEAALTAGTPIAGGARCPPGQVKHWLWKYDLFVEAGGQRQALGPDFHTVAGVSNRKGADPDDVYSKNGKRPVYGPGTGPSFRPPASEHATENSPQETPLFDQTGRPVTKVRTNMTETLFCLTCPSKTPPTQGPPAP